MPRIPKDDGTPYGRLSGIGFHSYYSGRAGDYFRSNKFKGVKVIGMWKQLDFFRKTKIPAEYSFFKQEPPIERLLPKPRETHFATVKSEEATMDKLRETAQAAVQAQQSEGIQ